MKRLRENAFMEAEIASDGTVSVEGHAVGELQGFRFSPDTKAEGADGRAVRTAAQKALGGEFEKRAERFANAPNGDLALGSDGLVRWLGAPVATLTAGEDPLKPRIVLLADEQLTGPARDMVANRLERFVTYQVSTVLKPLADLKQAEGLEGVARGLAYRLVEEYGILQRRDVAEEVRGLDQGARAALRRCGVRFGAYHIFVPTLIKPAPAGLLTLLWAIQNDGRDRPGFGDVTHLLSTGRTSAVADTSYDPIFYKLAGYRLLGRRAVRVDILERLADLIRPALAWKPGSGRRPDGGYNGAQFLLTPAMMSILGATADDMDEILKGLGYRPQPMDADAVELELNRLDDAAAAKEAADKAEAARKAAEAAASAAAPQPPETATETGAESAGADEDVASDEAVEAAAEDGQDEAPQGDVAPAGDAIAAEAPAEGVSAAADEPAVAAEAAAPDVTAAAEPTAEAASEEPAPAEVSAEASDPAEPTGTTVAAAAEAAAGDAAASADDAPDAAGGIVAEPEAQTAAQPTEATAEPATADDAAAEPAEQRIVQVWRPHRGDRNNAGQNRHGRRGRRPGQGAEPQGAQAADRPAEGRPAGRNQRPEADGDRQQRFSRGGNRPEGEERQQRRGKGGPKGKGRDFQGNDGSERPDRAPNRGPNRDKADGGGRRDKAPQRIDPDSPFAKLAALKEKLGR